MELLLCPNTLTEPQDFTEICTSRIFQLVDIITKLQARV